MAPDGSSVSVATGKEGGREGRKGERVERKEAREKGRKKIFLHIVLFLYCVSVV